MALSLHEAGHEYEREVDRVTDRLIGMPAGRLDEPVAGGRTRLVVAWETAQNLADAAADVEGRVAARPPVRRRLPGLPDTALADALAVVAHDLAAAADRLHPADPDAATAALDAGLEHLRTLRRAL